MYREDSTSSVSISAVAWYFTLQAKTSLCVNEYTG